MCRIVAYSLPSTKVPLHLTLVSTKFVVSLSRTLSYAVGENYFRANLQSEHWWDGMSRLCHNLCGQTKVLKVNIGQDCVNDDGYLVLLSHSVL